MARTAGTKKPKVKPELTPKKRSSFFDYLRFGESYTSLILGIVVVVIATALLLSFVHNKNAGNTNTPINEETQTNVQISQKVQQLAQKAPSGIVDDTITIAPTKAVKLTVVPTSKPKATVMPKPTSKVIKAVATIKPTQTVKAKLTPNAKPVMKKIVRAHLTPTQAPQMASSKNIWIVQKGESLWSIAEKKYTSGYNWVDIARANNLSNPSDIHVGDRLILPSVTPKNSTIATPTVAPTVMPTPTSQPRVHMSTVSNTNKITGNTYTVMKGDTLWDIAVRAYGDGYRWVDIARANNLANPGTIFSGNVLKIPR